MKKNFNLPKMKLSPKNKLSLPKPGDLEEKQ